TSATTRRRRCSTTRPRACTVWRASPTASWRTHEPPRTTSYRIVHARTARAVRTHPQDARAGGERPVRRPVRPVDNGAGGGPARGELRQLPLEPHDGRAADR